MQLFNQRQGGCARHIFQLRNQSVVIDRNIININKLISLVESVGCGCQPIYLSNIAVLLRENQFDFAG
jgi:hypothetical protein